MNLYLSLFYSLTGMDIFLGCLEQKIGIFCMRFYGFQNVFVPSILGLASPKYFLNLEILKNPLKNEILLCRDLRL